jgi:pyruvate dehydrogenase E1 component beta subunit
MIEEMKRDERVFLMGEEVAEYNGAYKVSEGMLQMFGPDRVIDTPISELGFAGIGVGAAMAGLRPIIEFMTFNFSLVAIDQVINSAAKTLSMSAGQFGAPMVFRGPSGSAGQLGAQHSQCFESWYGNTPGLIVVSPTTPNNAKGLLKSAIRNDNPVIFMESEQMYGNKGEVSDEADFLLPLGVCEVVKEGPDVTIVTFGKMRHVVAEAVLELEKQGIIAEFIDILTIRPLDMETILQSVRKTNRCVVVDESWPMFSVASEIAYAVQRYAFDFLDAPVVRVNNRDVPMGYAPTLVSATLVSAARVVDAARAVCYKN